MKTGKEIALPNSVATPGVAAGRLPARAYQENFADLRPPLTAHEAAVAADRCYFRHDAPCVTACPTAVDIPLFVRQISTGTARAAAKTIFDRNILGGMCARAGPTETLCEQACVREASEGKPVEIGGRLRAGSCRLEGGADPHRREARADAGRRRRARGGVRLHRGPPRRPAGHGRKFRLRADQVFKALGQKLDEAPDGVALEGRKIRVTGPGRTSRKGVWAGGDCVAAGDDLLVTAVAQGPDAAEDIHAALMD